MECKVCGKTFDEQSDYVMANFEAIPAYVMEETHTCGACLETADATQNANDKAYADRVLAKAARFEASLPQAERETRENQRKDRWY